MLPLICFAFSSFPFGIVEASVELEEILREKKKKKRGRGEAEIKGGEKKAYLRGSGEPKKSKQEKETNGKEKKKQINKMKEIQARE